MNICFYGRIGPGSLSWIRLAHNIISDFLSSSVTFHPRTLICISGMADNPGVLVSIDNIMNTIMVEMFMPELLPLSLLSLVAEFINM